MLELLVIIVFIGWVIFGILLATVFGRMVAFGQLGWPKLDEGTRRGKLDLTARQTRLL